VTVWDRDRPATTRPSSRAPASADYLTPGQTPAWAGSSREADAEALAGESAQRTPPSDRRREPLDAPAPAAEAEQGAQRLPPELRADLEPRFGVDLGDIRVRTEADVADRVGARAFALGRLVNFAPGAWSPRSQAGRDLIAHEVAHVVLDRDRAPAMASQKATGKPLFYQDVIDADNSSWGPRELAIRPIRRLCEVVDQEQTTEIDKAVKALDTVDLGLLPPYLPSLETASQLMARMVLLGAGSQVPRVQAWVSALPDVLRPTTVGHRRYYDAEAKYWHETVPALRQMIDWTSVKGSTASLDAYLTLIPLLLRQRDALPAAAVKEDAERLRAAGDPFPQFGMQRGPTLTVSRYYAHLAELSRQAFVDAMAAVQAMLDLATAELAAGRGTAVLDELDKRLERLHKLPMPEVADTRIDETVWEQVKGKPPGVEQLVQVDFFADQPGAARRRTVLEGYDVTMPFEQPLRLMSPDQLLKVRERQVAALRRIYGVETTGGKLTPEAEKNKAALAKIAAHHPDTPALRLHSDDDWRAFLLEKFRLHAASASAAEAFETVVDLLGVYLKAFTTHSPMNIADFGDNQLTQNFPRALTGQLVHDCGVYALRIAYMLSLIREDPKLKLQFRTVQLPVHIGLIITSDVAPIGAYLIHNDNVTHYEQAEVANLRAKWDVTDVQGQPRAAAAHTSKTDDEFYGELAADAFVPLTDVPFLVSEVPHLTGTAPAADKAALWAQYQKDLKHKLFSKTAEAPDSPLYQFHLRYLAMLEKSKRHYNQFVVPFWNHIAHPAWLSSRDALIRADAQRSSAKTAAEKANAASGFASAVKDYIEGKPGSAQLSLSEAFAATNAAYDNDVVNASEEITQEVQAHPEVVAPGASRASTNRLLEIFAPFVRPWWSREVQEHIDDLRNGQLTVPPYADDTQLIVPLD